MLFYREQQSIEAVARALELSEDAVKQRLSRGRKVLQEEVLAMVEGGLARTAPGRAFTVAVLAALPAFLFPAQAAVAAGTLSASGTTKTALASGSGGRGALGGSRPRALWDVGRYRMDLDSADRTRRGVYHGFLYHWSCAGSVCDLSLLIFFFADL